MTRLGNVILHSILACGMWPATTGGRAIGTLAGRLGINHIVVKIVQDCEGALAIQMAETEPLKQGGSDLPWMRRGEAKGFASICVMYFIRRVPKVAIVDESLK